MPDALEESAITLPVQSAEDVPAPLVAIALSSDGYWRRIWRSIVWQTEEYVKKDFAYSCLVGLFLGFLTLLDGSVTVTTLYWGVMGFLAVFSVRLAYHVVTATSLTDATLRKELEASEYRYKELTKYKIVPQIDEAATRIHLHTESPTVIRITANISLRFENKDIYPWTMKRLDAQLRKVGRQEEIQTWVYFRYMKGGVFVPKENFEGMIIPAGEMSLPYLAIAEISIAEEVKQASDLDLVTYLRLVVDASNQPPFNAEIFVSWEEALKSGGARPLYVLNAESINKLTDHRLS